MKSPTIALLFLVALAAVPAHSGGPGANSFQFLQLDANARPVGMGGAYTALCDDANALRYNPAGLGESHRHDATFMHNQYFQDISQEYLAYSSPWGIGGSLNMLKFGDVPRTTNSNPNGTGLGSTTLSAMAMSAGYGRAVAQGLNIGGAIKLVRQNVAGVTGQGFAADIGLLYQMPFIERLRLGAVFQNLGPAIRFQGAKERLPATMRLGVAYPFATGAFSNTFSFDILNELRNGTDFAFGAETVVMGRGAIRMGFDSRNAAGPGITVGMGLRVERISFDYAFVPFGELGSAHRFSISWRWGERQSNGGGVVAANRGQANGPSAVSRARLLREAESATTAGRFGVAEQALSRLERAGALDSVDSAHIAVLRGEVALALRRATKARAHFEGVVMELAGSTGGDLASRAFRGLARIAFADGDLRGSAVMLRKAIEAAPDEDFASRLRAEFRSLRKASE